MKKAVLSYAFILMICLFGCKKSDTISSESASADDIDWPKSVITITTGGAAGGPNDTMCRLTAAGLQEVLGQTVVVVNKPGGNGWLAVDAVNAGKQDGYDIAGMSLPAFIATCIDPAGGRTETFDDYIWLGTPGADPNVIYIRSDETRFTDTASLFKYAQTHELTATTTGVASDDDIAIRLMKKALPGTQITPTHFRGSPDALASVLGGHVDVGVTNVAEIRAPMEAGQIKVLFILDSQRNSLLPDVPTIHETGVVNEPIISNSSRGFIYPKGVDKRIVAKMTDAMNKVLNDTKFQQKLLEIGQPVNVVVGEHWYAAAKQSDADIRSIADQFGWELP
jgi:tripartite-type tricarboxylate transporter receptor subunit TctC